MVETGSEAVALYFSHVVAERLRPLVPRGGRVLDLGDRRGRVALHLEAAGLRVERDPDPEPGRPPSWDGAYVEVHDWPAARIEDLGERLVSGAPLLVRLERRAGQSPARVARELGSAFHLRSVASLGLLVPANERSPWAERHPYTFATLCALEGLVRAWPICRLLGRETLLLGARR